MSAKVKDLLNLLLIDTTHEERVEIDKEIEKKTGRNCDESINELSNEEFLEIVQRGIEELPHRYTTKLHNMLKIVEK
jgi:hypothetical protein